MRLNDDSVDVTWYEAEEWLSISGFVSAWERLRRAGTRPTLNADPGRFRLVSASCGNEVRPYVAILGPLDNPRAAIIGRCARRRIACHLGYATFHTPQLRCLDIVYGGLITDETCEADVAAAKRIRWLAKSRRFEHIMINHLPVDCRLFKLLTNDPVRPATTTIREPHWRFEIRASSFSDLVGQFSKKHRYNIRRNHRRLLQHFGGDLNTRRFEDSSDLNEFIVGTAGIAAQTYQAALGAGFSDTTTWRSLLQWEANQGNLQCYWLVCGGHPVAYQIGVRRGVTYFLEAMGYLPQFRDFSPGSVLFMAALEDLCKVGVAEIDYGFGDAEYKRTYGTTSCLEATLQFYGSGVRASTARILERTIVSTHRFGSAAARSVGCASLLRRLWRTKLSGT